MTCELLSVYFTLKNRTTRRSATRRQPPRQVCRQWAEEFELEPRRIEARGNPVIIRAESNGVYARVEHLDSTLPRVRMPAPRPARGDRTRLAASHSSASGRKPIVATPQAGAFRRCGESLNLGCPFAPNHRPGSTSPSLFEAHWSKGLKMFPNEGNHLISLLGDAAGRHGGTRRAGSR